MQKNYNKNLEIISLPKSRVNHWKAELPISIKNLSAAHIDLDCEDWLLTYKDLKEIIKILSKKEVKISKIRSIIPETIVSASVLGIEAELIINKDDNNITTKNILEEKNNVAKLLFHEGTLRSGERLSSEGDILLLGDVNPGAKISAGGNVLIWGRLRGVAHSGKYGNKQSKIIALELRPLQLRIANAIARGPEEKPEPGLAEEARLENGEIIIEPAKINSIR